MARGKKTIPPSTSQDEVDGATAYAKAVIAGEIITGPLVRSACERHERDRADGPSRGLYWDVVAAQRAIRFFPKVLRLAEGEFDGKDFILQPWQQFIIGSLFGWKAPDGFRRFRSGYIGVGAGAIARAQCRQGSGLCYCLFAGQRSWSRSLRRCHHAGPGTYPVS